MHITYPDDILKKLQLEELQVLKAFSKLCEKYDISWFPISGTLLGTVRHSGFIPWDDDIDIGMLKEDYEKFLKIPAEEYEHTYSFISPETKNTYYNFIPKFFNKNTEFSTSISAFGGGKVGIYIEIFPYTYVSDNKSTRLKNLKQLKRLSYMLHETMFRDIINTDNVIQKVNPIKRIAHHIIRIIFSLLGITSDKINRTYVKWYHRAISSTPTNTLAQLCYSDSELFLLPADSVFPLTEMCFEDLNVKIPYKTKELLTSSYGEDYMEIPSPENRYNHCPAYIKFSDGEEYDFTSQPEYTDSNQIS